MSYGTFRVIGAAIGAVRAALGGAVFRPITRADYDALEAAGDLDPDPAVHYLIREPD